MQTACVSSRSLAGGDMSMPRDEALKALIPHVGDRDIVVAVYQSCFDWLALNPRDLNYVAVGAMGQASSHGLGLALANPDGRCSCLMVMAAC